MKIEEKNFFVTFSEFLRSYIRDKYYKFMNDIQTEVNFFAWFDHYFKLKILAGRNKNTNNSLPQKEVMHTSKKTNTNNAFLQKDLQKEVIKLPSTVTSQPNNSILQK